jgi:hypothetical protein
VRAVRIVLRHTSYLFGSIIFSVSDSAFKILRTIF